MQIQELYNLALKHQQEHDCSAHPYENGERLVSTLREHNSKSILEIGTGCGYTAAIMAMVSKEIKIDTIEKDSVHAEVANKFIMSCGMESRVNIINKMAEDYLPSLLNQYDLIFFDGFQIHYEFLPHYERLLKKGGILFLGNNHLLSKTSDQFFFELRNSEKWRIQEQFDDTTIAIRN